MTNNLEHRSLVNALSMATRWIHSYQFPARSAEAISLCLVAFRLEQVFPLLRGGCSFAIRPRSGSQNNACNNREDKFLSHSNLQNGG